MKFFLEKQLSKPLSFCKILKKFLKHIQSYEDVSFLGPKQPIFPQQFFLVQTIIITFIYHIGPFQCAEVKKNSYSRSRIVRMWNFGPTMVHLPQTKFFLEDYSYHFHLLINPFHFFKILKKFFQQIQSYEDVQFLGPK